MVSMHKVQVYFFSTAPHCKPHPDTLFSFDFLASPNHLIAHASAESVLGPEMAQFQGPALLAYNDGVFTEKDFESISRIGDSKKREQIGKTGRFG